MALEKYTPNEIPTSTKFNALVDEVNSLSANKYTKPSSGIPATDLAAGVIPDSAEDITYDSTLESHTSGSVGAKLSDLSLKVGTIEGQLTGVETLLASI